MSKVAARDSNLWLNPLINRTFPSAGRSIMRLIQQSQKNRF